MTPCFHCLLCESVALSHETTTKEEEVMNRLKLKFLVTGTLNMINTLIEIVYDFLSGFRPKLANKCGLLTT